MLTWEDTKLGEQRQTDHLTTALRHSEASGPGREHASSCSVVNSVLQKSSAITYNAVRKVSISTIVSSFVRVIKLTLVDDTFLFNFPFYLTPNVSVAGPCRPCTTRDLTSYLLRQLREGIGC